MTQRQVDEFHILDIVAQANEPVGAGTLSKMLRAEQLAASEATVGRILSDLDERGYTCRVGYQGRKLTMAGKQRLSELKKDRNRTVYSDELVKLLRQQTRESLLEVLVARRAIERELARLAAVNTTIKDIKTLRRLVAEQAGSCEVQATGLSVQKDVEFHRHIAVIAGNKVLLAAVELIRQDGQLSPVLEYIRRQVESELVQDHWEIVNALADNDPDAAERAMVRHIEGLMKDVKKYWSETSSVAELATD